MVHCVETSIEVSGEFLPRFDKKNGVTDFGGLPYLELNRPFTEEDLRGERLDLTKRNDLFLRINHADDIKVRPDVDLELTRISTGKDDIFNRVVIILVLRLFQITESDLFKAQRGRANIAFARQLAMYLCHVVGQQNYGDIGAAFSRDRKTVSYACRVIEDFREDRLFNQQLEQVEVLLSCVTQQLKKF